MPATARRNARPRFPREGRVPDRSRPRSRASVKLRSSTAMAWQPRARARRIRSLMAARSRPSRRVAGSPARSSGIVAGGPAGLPSGVMTQAARCPWFRSMATSGAARSSSSAGTGGRGIVQDASRYQRSFTGSWLMS
ncbi:MAG: hypothetical protein J2P25_22630 [Nocardiopsaceae bacterium]|nr:hypothetical protein [Nocardiopsaceae bacterium]